MIGLLYLGFFLLYGFFSSKVVRWAVAWAKNRDKNPKLWGGISACLLFGLVFWDLIPVYVTQGYFCSKDAGFTTYITLDQWNNKYPGIAEKLIPELDNKKRRKIENDNLVFKLNQRFKHVLGHEKLIFGIRKINFWIEDVKTGEVLARFVDYDTNIKPIGLGARNIRDFKIWLAKDSCGKMIRKENVQYNDFVALIKKIGSEK